MEIPKRESLPNVVANQLKRLIDDGEIVGVLPGEYLLVEKLQVSRKTVRTALQILATSGYISAASRGQKRRVLSPNKERNVKQLRVAILTQNPLDSLNVSSKDLLRIVRTTVERHGARCYYFHADSSLKRDYKKKIVETLASHTADLWLLYDANKPIIEAAKALELPVLVCGSNSPLPDHFHSVNYDLNPTLLHAINVLFRHGHHHIFYPVTTMFNLTEHIQQSLANYEGEDPAHVNMLKYERTKASLTEVLEQGFSTPQLPSAVITDNSNLTTVVTWLGKKQLRIPEEVSVINVGDDPTIHNIYPEINHYSTSYKPIAKKLSSIAVKLLKNPHMPAKRHKLIAEYVAGDSLKILQT